MSNVKSDATIGVYLDSNGATVQDVRDWLAEVERLNLPKNAVLEECILSVFYLSEIVEPTYSESALGVEGIDILVGMPR